ncbi:hypothetical protein Ade02nite_56650 [Paractinoplanes deccanensis]|uniref:Uncharacterized protein n=1 Tax=Paractinoplanes deccanensis TaxID=113561 RepID=A0ABQ3YAI7_9ACTN|nr:hypothetical protein [Actinoplanes deccanensis]GID77024.1 hypothetical protein Ade02nite_56650 [Actinoplanes deccanensis]
MSRWTLYLWRALAALGEADYPLDRATAAYERERTRRFQVDLNDDTSVRAAFRSIMEWEYGARAFGDGK